MGRRCPTCPGPTVSWKLDKEANAVYPSVELLWQPNSDSDSSPGQPRLCDWKGGTSRGSPSAAARVNMQLLEGKVPFKAGLRGRRAWEGSSGPCNDSIQRIPPIRPTPGIVLPHVPEGFVSGSWASEL